MPFTVHTIDSAPAESREALAAIRSKFGGIPRAAALQAESPTLLTGFLAASTAFEESLLPPVTREAVILTVALRNGCEVCVRIHTAELARLGRPEVARELVGEEPPSDPAIEAVVTFVERLLEDSGRVGEAQLQEFLDAGHTRRHALEVVFGVGVYTVSTFANRLVGA